MKYVQGGSFVDKQFSIDETITEISDVVAIAKNISKNLSDNVSDDVKKELNLIIVNLSEAESLLKHVEHKVKIALQYVPIDAQEKEFL